MQIVGGAVTGDGVLALRIQEANPELVARAIEDVEDMAAAGQRRQASGRRREAGGR